MYVRLYSLQQREKNNSLRITLLTLVSKNALNFPSAFMLDSYIKKEERKIEWQTWNKENKGAIMILHTLQFPPHALKGDIHNKTEILR